MFNGKVIRSDDIKDVIHIKVKKFAGYFNPESRSFAVDPHLTTFEDLQKILIEAFNLSGPFHLTYLCRDDAGENVFLSMLTEWDLDAAFMTSSDPFLRLKLDAEPYQDGLMTKMKDFDTPDSSGNIIQNHSKIVRNILQPVTGSNLFQNTQKSWINSVEGAFSKLSFAWNNTSIQDNPEGDFYPTKPPLDDAEFRTFLGGDGVLSNPEGLRLRVYNGGVAPALRKVIWRMLLNIFPADMTGKERISYIKRKSDEYEALRAKWQARAESEQVKSISNMVWKDVLRTDRSHLFFKGSDDNPNVIALMNILTTFALTHPNLSYCQGMSDLASPILIVMNNESQAYVCFCGLMRRLRDNFSSHGRAISKKFKHLALLVERHDPQYFAYLQDVGADNMFFCYRWILLEMKREFSFDDSITVLEVIWSSLPPHPPHKDLPLEDYSEMTSSEDRDFSPQTASNTVIGSGASQEEKDASAPEHLHCPTGSARKDRKSVEDVIGKPRDNSIDLSTSDDIDFHTPRSDKRTADLNSPQSRDSIDSLPPPEELGCGHPFLLFVCLAVLLHERDAVLSAAMEYDDMVMHFDKMARTHSPKKILSRAMKLFAEYLRSDASSSSST